MTGTLLLLLLVLAGVAAAMPASPSSPTLFFPSEQVRIASMSESQTNFLKRAVRLPEVVDYRLVRVDTAAMARAAAGDIFSFSLFDDAMVDAKMTRRVDRSDSDFSFFAADELVHVVAVVAGEHVYATIRSGRLLFSVKSLGGGLQVLLKLDESRFPPELDPLADDSNQIISNNNNNNNDNEKKKKENTFISTIIAYTPGAAEEVVAILPLVQLAVDETNEGYLLSNVALTLNVTRVYQTDYSESASYSTDLSRFRTKNDGFMDEVHALRNSDRANIAHLIVSSGSSCGVASTIMATTTTAFCLTAQDCATGYYTFGHEMGHLQGARHNPEQDSSVNPFPYGHGHIIAAEEYRSIMAYNEDGETRVLRWSNPDVDYDGHPTGTASCCDNARVLDETAATTASWCAVGSCA